MAYSFPDYRKVFSIFDKGDTGTIATGDLGDALRVLGYNPTDEEIDELVQEASDRGDIYALHHLVSLVYIRRAT